MNFKKHFLLFVALVCFAALISGCGNGSNSNVDAAPTATVTPVPATATPTPTPITDNSIKFDFGFDPSLAAENWTTVTVPKKTGDGTTGYTYTKELGYGFITPDGGKECVGANDKKLTCTSEAVPENVFKDYAVLNNSEFVVDIENGVYTVQILSATTSSSLNYYTVEGQTSDVSVDPDNIASINFTNVVISDGQLNITSTGTGLVGGLINGIVIVPLGNATYLTGSADLKAPSCTLNWKAAENALSYNIYRTDRDGNTAMFTTTETTYTDTTVELINEYTYYVKAEAGIELESEPTNELHLTTLDTSVSVPAAVTDLKVTALTDSATTLEWKASSAATKYYVYTADKEFPDATGVERYTLLGTTDSTTFTVNRTTNIARYYKVFAANAGGLAEPALVRAEYGLTLKTQVEKLDRGLVAVPTSTGNYLSWRLAGEEYAAGTTFEVYRDGTKIADISATANTNYLDASGKSTSSYTVKTYTNGKMTDEASTTPWATSYIDVPIQNPKNYNDVSAGYTYEANDMSIGDVDGDGAYELFVKWNPTNAKDNSQSGKTGPVFIDCYKIDGTLLWRIYLGVNIRAGAHYTQYMVYDFDSDGKCELICKTSDGTIDGQGTVIGDINADYRDYGGHIIKGNEFLTLFDCETGAALDTINYTPERGSAGAWGDGSGNRSERYLAGVAYLDGEHPSAIFCRGYYTRGVVVAYDVVDDKLVLRWVCDSNVAGNEPLAGQGAHSLSVGDIDDDGFHEIVYGAASVDHDGTFMYSLSTANGPLNGGHGDALHVSDFDLSDSTNEVFMVHESSPLKDGVEMHNGENGVHVYNITTTADVGRGAAADIDPNYEGAESWAQGKIRTTDGTIISESAPVANFVIHWDGDLGREILDSNVIYEWYPDKNYAGVIKSLSGTSSNNGTKSTPNLQADFFGDWREEVLMKKTDSSAIRIFTTTDVCDYRLYTLMHDTQYRCAIAWQNTGYNQPPHTSFYIGFDETLMEVPVVNWEYAGQ